MLHLTISTATASKKATQALPSQVSEWVEFYFPLDT